MRYAVSFVYGYGLVFSNILWLTLYLAKSDIRPVQLMCLYGYSLSSFLGICLICIIPSPVLHWLLAAYGTLNSTALIISNLQAEVEKMEKQQKMIFFGVVAAGQLIFMLVFKILFYDLKYK